MLNALFDNKHLFCIVSINDYIKAAFTCDFGLGCIGSELSTFPTVTSFSDGIAQHDHSGGRKRRRKRLKTSIYCRNFHPI
jgi:hypothetical protein